MSEIREKITAGKEWPAHLTYVPALRVGNMVWLSGTTKPKPAADASTTTDAAGD